MYAVDLVDLKKRAADALFTDLINVYYVNVLSNGAVVETCSYDRTTLIKRHNSGKSFVCI